ncbi:PAS domain S-box-containing protein [Methanomicrobium sp. W14]|uniref:ATP-binding response regulator n=1 Tax=Methanomicrobium sp. W14 TaxID=2817839 RepID=UPI001AEA4434|nr:response regulator [Methanomicrobium sp. W14]MBP2133524.1 PAS domain S-box-containing protein [Methanomicrobium sp. W14]
MKVLVVDDLNENRYLLESVLKSRGYEVITAANGEDALNSLNKSKPDLIISDILMPKMDGFQLCREVKSDENLKDIPFVFYTAAYTSPEDQKFGLDLGADRYIIKPVDPDEFLKIIDGMLKNPDIIAPMKKSSTSESEEEYLKKYTKRVLSQLETKIEELEKKNADLLKSQNALKESENKFHILYNSIMEAVLFYEVKPNKMPGRILEVNETACKNFGYSYEEFLKKNIDDLYVVPPGEDYIDYFATPGEESRYSFEEKMKKKDSTVFPVYIKAGLIEIRDTVYGLCLIRDISREKESRRREAEALKDIEDNLATSAILNDAIRNPLAVISGYAEICNDEISDKILSQVKEINDIITRLDRGWLQSAKIREFLKKHYDFSDK